MTWGEFKEWVESYGVDDDMEIAYIDFDPEPSKVTEIEEEEIAIT